MTRTRTAGVLIAGAIVVSAASLTADVRTEEKALVKFEGMLGRMASMFGGKAAKDGVKSAIAVQGDRKASLNEQNGQIIDLKEERIYDLDIRRKQYRVTTFAELRQRMEEARKKAEESAKENKSEAQPDQSGKEIEVDVDVTDTGQSKTINGFATRQVVMTIAIREKGRTLELSGGLVLTTDMWLTPRVAAMSEIAEFDLRYAKQLAGPMISGASAEEMASAMAMYPGLKDAMTRARTESATMDGTSIMTTVTVESVKSAEQMAAEKQGDSSASASTPTSVGGLIGGFARRAQRPQEPRARATFMTSTTEVLKIGTAVSATDVSIPAGFREDK